MRQGLAHNHPGSSLVPGKSDHLVTKSVQKALALFNIELRDHLLPVERICILLQNTICFNDVICMIRYTSFHCMPGLYPALIYLHVMIYRLCKLPPATYTQYIAPSL
ncbi:JAB domain-containing protein [Klebsiella aerogenes]|uniref:JAB domain-containing protein n=1 Tax=Klebsiella aerogenes TaxID=548 RepID=UPI0039A6DAD3